MNNSPKADDTPDFCCATLLCNLLRNKVAHSATIPNALLVDMEWMELKVHEFARRL